MLFNSLTFLVFFIILLVIYYLLPSWKQQKLLLLVSSYLFYGAWKPIFLLLLWFSTMVDWYLAQWIENETNQTKRNLYLLGSLITNLGLLGYFKYGNFILDNFSSVLSWFGIEYNATIINIILPVGISFYTFQTLSYTLDVYLKRTKPCDSFSDFALYVTFFPQLVAGPIVRSTDFLPQCKQSKSFESNSFYWGLFLLTLGLFQKIVLADTFLAPTADLVFGFEKGGLHPFDAWIGVLAFSGQIFFDFSGYSTCAIGIAMCFGFFLPDNFKFPYAAIGFSDFWHRWHITLSTWLRDYLYIPLGGNRKTLLRTLINIMIVMLLGGLWHGASWTFVIWGGLHGIYLVIERLIRTYSPKTEEKSLISDIFAAIVTYIVVNATWVFFRAQDIKSAWLVLSSMFGFTSQKAIILPTVNIIQVSLTLLCLVFTHWRLRNTSLESAMNNLSPTISTIFFAGMLSMLVLAQGGGNAFIYFQF